MPVTRIPWSWPLDLRDRSLTKTPRRINVIDQVVGDRHYTLRRPGLHNVFDTAAGEGQGLYYQNGQFYSVVDDRLYISSGSSTGSNGLTWTQTSDAPWAAREDFQTLVVNGVLFVMGGLDNNGDPCNDVWSIQPGQGWKLCTAAAPWAGRAGFMLGYIDDTIYVMGGAKAGFVICTDVWSSTDGSSWQLVTDQILPDGTDKGARYGAGCISADNGIYLIGGRDAASVSLNSVLFSVDGKEWSYTTEAAAWTGREFMATWYYKNKLWIGGGESSSSVINEVWSSDDGGRNWIETSAAAFVTGLSFAGFTVYANLMWLVNGWDGSAVTNRVYRSDDGVTWTVVTTDGPAAPMQAGAVIIFETATAISQYNYQTMYWMGGLDAGGSANNEIWYADLDIVIAAVTDIDPPITEQPYQFASFNNGTRVLVKNECGLWVLDGGALIPVLDIGYPVETVPGIVVLGRFAYVCDPSGLIRNCDLDDPYHWPMLNAVGADYEDDRAVAIAKYLNYLVVFGEWTIQFFYDAGITVGSPLLPYLSGNMKIGCDNAATVCGVGPTIIWVSRTRQLNRQVMAFNGLSPQVISTPAIDEILNGNSHFNTLSAFTIACEGHLFYVIYGADTPSLVYDFQTKEWFEWCREAITIPFAATGAVSALVPFSSYMQHPTNGKIYSLDLIYTDDDTVPFPVQLITGKVDAGNNRNKFWGQTEVIGDRNDGLPEISWSDDDYQTFSTPRTVDMNTPRPVLYRNGVARRRIFKYEQTDVFPIRLEALEIDFEQGN